jgi:hypothetical protein
VPVHSFITRAGIRIAACATFAACATTANDVARVIVTLAPGVQVTDPAGFEQAVLARTSVKVTYAAAVSDRMHALTVSCTADDAGCVRARQALLASGLFSSLVDDRRRGHY